MNKTTSLKREFNKDQRIEKDHPHKYFKRLNLCLTHNSIA